MCGHQEEATNKPSASLFYIVYGCDINKVFAYQKFQNVSKCCSSSYLTKPFELNINLGMCRFLDVTVLYVT